VSFAGRKGSNYSTVSNWLMFLLDFDDERPVLPERPNKPIAISRRSQFEVSEESLFADVPHVGRQHGQHLFVGPAVFRPPGYGVNGKRMPQVLQAKEQRAVLSGDARCPSKPGKGCPAATERRDIANSKHQFQRKLDRTRSADLVADEW
jgi:hypothetical protein